MPRDFRVLSNLSRSVDDSFQIGLPVMRRKKSQDPTLIVQGLYFPFKKFMMKKQTKHFIMPFEKNTRRNSP